MSKPVSHGILLPFAIKPEHSHDWEEFIIKEGPPGVKQEPDTIYWFGSHYGGNKYDIFDLFPHEEGRNAHLTGAVAKAVFGHADWFAENPEPMLVNVLATKSSPKHLHSTPKAGVSVGLRVLIKAKKDKINDVRKFLSGALPLVEEEPGTIYWAAIELPGTNTFGIVDQFADEAGRDAHFAGKVAEALFANVETLLEGPPDVVKTTILAGLVQ